MAQLPVGNTWPPVIDWDLLLSTKRDPSAPRAFLKQESWKLLLGSKLTRRKDESGCSLLLAQLHVPEALKGLPVIRLNETVQHALLHNLAGIVPSLDPSSIKIEFEFIELEGLDAKRGKELHSQFRDRELEQWLRLYLKGLYFAEEIGRPGLDRYVFIEEVYFPTEEFKQARRAYLEAYHKPLLITGVPRTGKTYTAMRLLYEVLEDPEASIKFINHWSDPNELLDLAREARNYNSKLFAVLDDPFGVDEYMHANASISIEVIRKLIEGFPEVRLLITSREEIYHAAERHQNELSTMEFLPLVFNPERMNKTSRLFPEILERTAWLHGANWRNQLRRFIGTDEFQAGTFDDLGDAWLTALRQCYVPGVFLSAFILYPQIIHLDIQDPADVRNLALALGRAVDVGSAFRSELDTLLLGSSSEKILYLLLPSFTLVQDETLAGLFTADEREHLGKELSRYFETTGGGDFAVYSYRYQLDVFAEVAQQLLEEDGLRFLEQSILPELEKRVTERGSGPAELLADVLCRYFWLGGQIGNQHVITLMQSLKEASNQSGRLDISRERDQVYLLGALFQRHDPKLGYDLLVEKLTTADPLLVSKVASILDQLLTTQVRQRAKLVGRMALVVGRLHNEYFQSQNAEESSLRASLLLHGVLSHLENYFLLEPTEGLAPTRESKRDDEAFRNLLGVRPLMMRISQREKDWILPALMWLDAIVMKLGELRLYLIEHQIEHEIFSGYEGLATSLPEEVIRQNTACGILYKRLLDELEEVSSAIHEIATEDEIELLRGGLFFTLTWHNRWCLAKRHPDEINEIARWADNRGWRFSSESRTSAYWRGISFNLNYHARYFEVKASAWQRESAIYRLHEKAPRLGSDTPHESGLPVKSLREDWRPTFKAFYEYCLGQLLPCDSDTGFIAQEDVTSQASFLLGIRSHRDPSLQDDYVSRIQWSLRMPDCPWRDHLGRAIVKLFAFNLRESMEVVTQAIRAAGSNITREGREALLHVIDEVEYEFNRKEVRYASKNLETLRRLLTV